MKSYYLLALFLYSIAHAGPPPNKKGRLESDESALSTDPIAPTHVSPKSLSTTDSAASAGPSKMVSGSSNSSLDTKLGTHCYLPQSSSYRLDLKYLA